MRQVFLILLLSSFAYGQSITLNSPNTPATYREADEFSASVLRNRWDMDQRRDIAWEENYVGSSVTASNGIWSATNEGQFGYIFPLWGGFDGDGKIQGPDGEMDVPKLGINHPINTGYYTHLSIKYAHSDPDYITVYWRNESTGVRWPQGENFVNFPEDWGVPGNQMLVRTLSLAGVDNESWSEDPQSRAGSWTGDAIMLRIDPAFQDQAGDVTQIDWIRMFRPDPALEINFSFNYNSLPSTALKIMADDDGAGYDGYPVLLTDTYSGSGSVNRSFNLSALPPGTYYFYVESADGSVRSNYSAAMTIDDRPVGYFTSPGVLSGEEYSADVLGNPWDMDSATDVPNLNSVQWPQEWRQFVNPTFNNGVFTATAERAYAGRTESDAQVHVNIGEPIDTRKYRYLTYTMGINESGFTDLSDRVERGWVARAAWWNTSFAVDHGSSRFHVVYEGMQSYTLDLWDENMKRFGRDWLQNAQVRGLRVDPLETDQLTEFYIDDVFLTAEPREANDQFTITWNLTDNTGGNLQVDLYYDDNDSGFDGTLISSNSVPAGVGNYTWDTSGLSDGAKYIYMVVTDTAGNSSAFYAEARVQIGEYQTPVVLDVPYDYDGDGASDEVVYRPQIGTFFINGTANGPFARAWGGMPFEPIHGDFDGDGRADPTVIVNINGFMNWFTVRSSDDQPQVVSWGLPGDQFYSADFDGDRRDDYAVYRGGVWFIFSLSGRVTIAAWGEPTDIPVPADYDGDGREDIAIWRPRDGNWWIINSGYTEGGSIPPVTVQQWGLPGDIPMPADMDVDGKVDYVVWRQASGHWFIRNSSDDEIEVVQWGLPGDTPFVGDYNGDGVPDLSVFRPGIAYWFHNYRNGQIDVQQWGLNIDKLVK